MKRLWRRNICIFGAIAALAVFAGCGKVTRQLQINSDPAGALVYLNGEEVGRTPCTVDFTWYGRYDLAVRREGYSALIGTQNVVAPWWQWIPLDLVADVTPGHKVDKRYYFYVLEPLPTQGVDAEVLIDRAHSMRPMLESGEFTRKAVIVPTTAEAVTPPATMPADTTTDSGRNE